MIFYDTGQRSRWTKVALVAVIFLLCSAVPLAAQPEQGGAPQLPAAKEKPQNPNYPGLEKVVPKAAELDAAAGLALQQIEALRRVGNFNRRLQELHSGWRAENAKISEFGEISEWPVNRILNVRNYLEGLEAGVVQLLNRIAEPLSTLEGLRKNWSGKRGYWQGWEDSLQQSGAKVPQDTFNEVQRKIGDILERTAAATATLVGLQEDVSRLSQDVVGLKETIDAELAALKESPFRRNALPLLSPDYFRQFDHELIELTRAGARAALQVRSDFFERQGWLLIAQVFLAAVLIAGFIRLRNTAADQAEDWHFIIHRPFSAAFFISLSIPYLFYQGPPPLLQLAILFAASISAARLACALLEEGNQRTFTYTLAGLFILSKIFTTLALPGPFYRLYLSLLVLCGIPFLIWMAKRHRKHVKSGVDRYMLLLYSGQIVLLITLCAQIGGFATFSLNLINATVGTIFLLLFSLMALRIAEGAIDLFFNSKTFGGSRFVRNLGPQASNRFNRLVRLVIVATVLLYLLEIWHLFDNITAAWNFLMALEFTVGEFHVSVRMVLLVVVVIYISMIVSWFFQSFLESQVFFGKRIDRGVRDAFKKLGHYALVLVGFITAMTMAGIELKNFAILAGAFGIGIGFGMQDIVNNFISGLILLFERPIKVGDAVIIDGQWGAINKIGMRSTVVETWDHSEIIVPNSHMISEKVQNWTLTSNVSRITIKVGVRYGSDLDKVVEILSKVGRDHPSVVDDPPASAIFTDFGDSSINFELRVWVDNIRKRLSLISDLGLEVDRAFNEAGIEIPFPQRDLHLRSIEPDVTLPPPAKKPAAKKTTTKKKTARADGSAKKTTKK